MTVRRCLVLLILSVLLIPAAVSFGGTAEKLDEIRSIVKQPSGYAIESVTIDLGMGTIELTRGTLYPFGGFEQSSLEALFVGSGEIRFTPPNELEAGQLELFTGGVELEESFSELTIALNNDAVIAEIRSALRDEGQSDELRLAASKQVAEWVTSAERELMGVEMALLLDASGDRTQEDFIAASIEGDELGKFIFSIDRGAAEPVTLGQFVRLEMSEKEKRKSQRSLHRQQRRGRFIGVDLDDLGTFDTWVSSKWTDADGVTYGGAPGFTPRHYKMNVAPSRDGKIDVSCAIDFESLSSYARSILLELDSDLVIEEVLDSANNRLFHHQLGSQFYVFLDEATPAGETLHLEVRYAGSAISKLGQKSYSLANPTGWYPRVGFSDLATYDVTFATSVGIDVVASGKPVGERHYIIDQPVGYFSFEIGDYELEYFDINERVRATVAWDRQARSEGEGLEKTIKALVSHTLNFYESTFGEYPFDFLTVVTVPRGYGQSLPGFITLPSWLTSEVSFFEQFLVADRRMFIAHEVAHQWWGHVVMFDSYRDQWISEAMASYSASAWVNATIPPESRPGNDLTLNWWDRLNDVTENRRTVDSLGPLVLGARLNSSHYPGYFPIVYSKGAVVLNTLASAFGEESFLKLLNRVVAKGRGTFVSSEELIEMMEEVTSQDLDWFQDRYINGTGIPKIYYSYSIDEAAEGAWSVSVDLEQESSFLYEYRVTKENETWGFEISTKPMFDANESVLAIPVQIRVKQEGEKKKKRRDWKSYAQLVQERGRIAAGETIAGEKIAEGRIIFRGNKDSVSFDVPFEPQTIWLDRSSDVYGRFYDSSRWPRDALIRKGLAASNAGESERALALYEQALQAKYYMPRDPDNYDFDDDKDRDAESLIRVRLLLVELHLRFGATELAREQLQVIKQQSRKHIRPHRERFEVAMSRLDLADQNYNAIMDRLRKRLRGADRMSLIEGYALVAIAAHETGDLRSFESAAETAEENGVDLDLLNALR